MIPGILFAIAAILVVGVYALARVAAQADCACPYECEYHPTESTDD